MKNFFHKLGFHFWDDKWDSEIKSGTIRTCSFCGKQQECVTLGKDSENRLVWYWKNL